MKNATTSPEFFEHIYRQAPDPWDFASSEYEQSRYSTILHVLSSHRYVRAFEPGCSVGILTALLSTISDQVEAIDVSPTAVARARVHCKECPNVNLVCGALPESFPAGQFDLVVFSEIGYYFRRDALLDLGDRLASQISQSGTFLAVHWLGQSPDHLLSGDEVHRVLRSIPNLRHIRAERHTGFILDLWERA